MPRTNSCVQSNATSDDREFESSRALYLQRLTSCSIVALGWLLADVISDTCNFTLDISLTRSRTPHHVTSCTYSRDRCHSHGFLYCLWNTLDIFAISTCYNRIVSVVSVQRALVSTMHARRLLGTSARVKFLLPIHCPTAFHWQPGPSTTIFRLGFVFPS